MIHFLADDEGPDLDVEAIVALRLKGPSNEVGELLDGLETHSLTTDFIAPEGWVKTFYGYEYCLPVWKENQ
jgi:hypothetical protein